MNKLSLVFAAAIASLGACSPYNPDLGNAPYLCGADDGACPDGYTCQATTEATPRMVCVSGTGLEPDAMQVGFPCADDSSLEGGARNDTKDTAYQTPVDTQRLDLTLAGLAICPKGDKDHYAITVSASSVTAGTSSIEVIVSWDSGQPLSMSILNTGGTSIGNGTMNAEKSLRACVPNMPAGTYFTSVFGAAMTENNYRLAVKLKANCAI